MLFHIINHKTKDPFDASQIQSDILTDEHWENRRGTDVGNPPCRASMQAYSSAIRTNQDIRIDGPKWPQRDTLGENMDECTWVLYVSAGMGAGVQELIWVAQMPYLHWEYASIISQIESLTEEVTKPIQHADVGGVWPLSQSEIAKLSCSDDEKLLRLYCCASQPMQVRRTLSSSHYCFSRKRKPQFVNKVAEHTEATALPSNKDTPVLMVDQLWMWLVGNSM